MLNLVTFSLCLNFTFNITNLWEEILLNRHLCLLTRHKWRKVLSDTRHKKKRSGAPEDLKKKHSKFKRGRHLKKLEWLSALSYVSGRGTFWKALRPKKVLVPKVHSKQRFCPRLSVNTTMCLGCLPMVRSLRSYIEKIFYQLRKSILLLLFRLNNRVLTRTSRSKVPKVPMIIVYFSENYISLLHKICRLDTLIMEEAL
jgi:hypothetical protein